MRKRGVTMRTWLAVQVMAETGCTPLMAKEAVASTALAHPEWDLDERKTWEEWNQQKREQQKKAAQ
jgi:hypothetical protein